MIRGADPGVEFATATFDTFKAIPGTRLAIDACRKVLHGEAGGAVLMGAVGNGKTHLMVSLARAYAGEKFGRPEDAEDGAATYIKVPPIRELMRMDLSEFEKGLDAPQLTKEEMGEKDRHVEYWPILDLVCDLRDEIRQGGRPHHGISRRCRDCDLLILDDLGEERETEFVHEELARIIDWRYRQQLPIAISTNLGIDELQAKYGARLVSRLVARCAIVEVTAGDYRVQS